MRIDPAPVQPAAGPHDPLPTTPPRPPGSVRRTSSIDTSWPAGQPGTVRITGRARDLRTRSDGSTTADELEIVLLVDERDRRRVLEVAVGGDPGLTGGADRLVGVPLAGGLRRALAELLPDHVATRSLLNSVLDDLPGAGLVSGYRDLRVGRVGRMGAPGSELATQHLAKQEDLCAGWAVDGGMMRAARAAGAVPVPYGPVSPDLERDDDPQSWHRLDRLPPASMRRARRVDLQPADGVGAPRRFETHFRDAYAVADGDGDGESMVLHEYLVTGAVDPATATVVEVEAQARVLPWAECPGSLGSAGRTVGVAVGELPALVHTDFRGTSTCTHLNDSLRFLADLAPLLG